MQIIPNAQVTVNENGNKVEDNLLIYSEEEREKNEENSNNAQLLFRPEFIPFPYKEWETFELSYFEGLLFGYIKFFLSNNEKFFIGNEKLAELFKCSDITVSFAIKRLIGCNLISATYKTKSNGGKIRIVRLKENLNSDLKKNKVQTYRKLKESNNNLVKNNLISPKGDTATPKIYGSEEINKMIDACCQRLCIDSFASTKLQQRNFGQHLVSLFHKLGKEEFLRRLDLLQQDGFKSKRLNEVDYLYRELKGFMEPIKKNTVAFIS